MTQYFALMDLFNPVWVFALEVIGVTAGVDDVVFSLPMKFLLRLIGSGEIRSDVSGARRLNGVRDLNPGCLFEGCNHLKNARAFSSPKVIND